MERWEIALHKFLRGWENKKEVVGAIACGSYVTGNPSAHSDIDLHLILKKETKWRERGNVIIDGILIEYFANTLKRHSAYAKEDLADRRRINAHMFSTGKVIFDKNGDLRKIIANAKKDMLKKYPRLNFVSVEQTKYALWDMMDNLEEIYDARAKDFPFVYHVQLNSLFEQYSKFVGFESIPPNKLRRFLVNKGDQKKYKISRFPDSKFVKMYLDALCLEDESEMINAYRQLTAHVLRRMGGFNINGWKLRTPA